MASRNGNVTRVLISIVFIALGLGFAIDAASNIFDGDFESVLAINSVLGILMFVLGIMGISKASMKACKIIAVVVCLLAMTSFVLTVFTFEFKAILGGITTTFVWGLLAWIYFDLT
ncbi:MAG: hypothetical protein E7678_01355 [Ruminococcaceae bacterium]|nr:hypothetical protein [Oscillospiraceae bacterium]